MKHIFKTTALIAALINLNACAHTNPRTNAQTPAQAHCALLDDFLTEMGPQSFREALGERDIWVLVNICPEILKDLEDLEAQGF